MQSGVVGVDTVIYLRLYGQICASANVCRVGRCQVGAWCLRDEAPAREPRAQAEASRVETLAPDW